MIFKRFPLDMDWLIFFNIEFYLCRILSNFANSTLIKILRRIYNMDWNSNALWGIGGIVFGFITNLIFHKLNKKQKK